MTAMPLSRKWLLPCCAAAAFIFLTAALWLGFAWSRQASAGGPDVPIATDRPIRVEHGQAEGIVDFNASPEGSPRARLSADYYDFGVISSKATVRRDFLVVNNGDAPLIIRRAYTTCGCTTAELSASRIPPGQAARVTVIFDAGFHNVSGQTVRRGLILETNDPDRPEVEIWVQAEIGQ